jgi:putative transcriptional regulator
VSPDVRAAIARACGAKLCHLALVTVELAPGFLVAAPSLRDPNFLRTVILLVAHGEDGSLGFVVNRVAPFSFAQVSELLGLSEQEDAAHAPILAGGPVAPQSGWILFDPRGQDEDALADAVRVSARLAVSASRRLLESIASESAPERCLLALGYAGWGSGQLDEEFARGAWIPVDLDDRIVFDVPIEERWQAALESAGIDPARMGAGSFSA